MSARLDAFDRSQVSLALAGSIALLTCVMALQNLCLLSPLSGRRLLTLALSRTEHGMHALSVGGGLIRGISDHLLLQKLLH